MGCSVPESGDDGYHVAQRFPTSRRSTHAHIRRRRATAEGEEGALQGGEVTPQGVEEGGDHMGLGERDFSQRSKP